MIADWAARPAVGPDELAAHGRVRLSGMAYGRQAVARRVRVAPSLGRPGQGLGTDGIVYLTARDLGRGERPVAGLQAEGLSPRRCSMSATAPQ
jgi:hypothetical protein